MARPPRAPARAGTVPVATTTHLEPADELEARITSWRRHVSVSGKSPLTVRRYIDGISTPIAENQPTSSG